MLPTQREHSEGRSFHISERIEAKSNIQAFQRCWNNSGTNSDGGGEQEVVTNMKGYGFVDFYPIRSLEQFGYVVDDTLVFKVQVTGVKPAVG